MLSINVNSMVTVQLTETGKKAVRDWFEELRQEFIAKGKEDLFAQVQEPYISPDGMYTVTIWELMNQIGIYCVPGNEPIVNNLLIHCKMADKSKNSMAITALDLAGQAVRQSEGPVANDQSKYKSLLGMIEASKKYLENIASVLR